ncbi:sensor histidine kinase [Aquabacterium olei]|uniref:histidine kinase n=1 Tax=Aquabacterium olei TaxID=1296669 RepID=A0A2U8FSN1_9BURK|nr:sensor histidine kinase [Aquabacterium olei]AWI54065.1 sensor histidine kinase [Aquabacterium olei]
MSLRLRLTLVVVALMALTVSLLAWREINGTRRSVHEEIEAASRVAVQVLRVVNQLPFDEARIMVQGLGRVRANEITLFDAQGSVAYVSPPSPYKPGRQAPDWFAGLVTPRTAVQDIALPGGRLSVRPDPSRAVLDGWDEFVQLMLHVAAGLVVVGGFTALTLVRTLAPLARIEAALRSLQRGQYDTRLPALPGREAALMSQAFNDMAQSIQDNLHARDEARAAQASLAQSRELTQVILQRVEAERARIARDLHDELGQQLTALRTVAQVLSQDPALMRDKAELVGLLKRVSDDMAASLQGMLPRLRPLALDRLGLQDALSDLLLDWRQVAPTLDITLHVAPLPDGLGDTLATAAYRIVQEAVTNAIKHAQARRITVTLTSTDHALELTVQDDGIGLPAAWQRPGHHGLLGIRERVQALGGTLALSAAQPAAPHPGLRLSAALPWSQPPVSGT